MAAEIVAVDIDFSELADEIRKRPHWQETFAREPVERLALLVAEDQDFDELRDNLRDFKSSSATGRPRVPCWPRGLPGERTRVPSHDG
jgi:hypothetical protein